jgi:FKBP-type peptidyl-prolyl cis-trans isomerase SlyD
LTKPFTHRILIKAKILSGTGSGIVKGGFMKCAVLVLTLAIGCAAVVAQVSAAPMTIQNGSKVAFEYTLTVDGKVIDSSEGKAPLEYTQGEGKMLPGLARQLEGLKVGDEKNIEVKPEEAYGSPDPAALKEVPITKLPPEIKPEVGMILQGQDKEGRSFPARIAEVKKDSVVMDLNHPLAGKTLFFKVKIVSVK